MRNERSPGQHKLLIGLGALYIAVGLLALLGALVRDVLGIAIGLHGSLLPLSLLLLIGLGLLVVGRDSSAD